MKAIYALYDDPDIAQDAVNGLRAAGIADRAIVIRASEPFDEHEFGARDAATSLPKLAAVGGALGLTFAFWLTQTVPRLCRDRGWAPVTQRAGISRAPARSSTSSMPWKRSSTSIR